MANPFIGEIEYFAFDFAPKGWVHCAGQLLPVNQNQALFSLLGTTYGGDGIATFGLPDLRSRVAVAQGAGLGLSAYALGQEGGQETVTLVPLQMPSHTHNVTAVSRTAATFASPATNLLSIGNDGTTAIDIYSAGAATGPMAQGTIGNNSGGKPHDNRMPFLALMPCISLIGAYPSRN